MSNTIEVMAQWLSGLWCWIYHVCLGFKSFEWQNILHLDCHGLDWIPFEILRSKKKDGLILRVLHFQRWINPFSVKIWRHTSYRDVSILTYFVLCVVLIWLYIIIINRRRRIAVTLDGTSETRPPFVACFHAIRDLFL